MSAVSPSTNLILSTPMPTSSAAICGMEIRNPWPRSTLPQNSVTVPSPFTARKEINYFGIESARGSDRILSDGVRGQAGQCKADGERAAFEDCAAGETGVFDGNVRVEPRCPDTAMTARTTRSLTRNGRDCRRAPSECRLRSAFCLRTGERPRS